MQILSLSLDVGLLSLNVAVAAIALSIIAMSAGFMMRRSTLPLRHGLLCTAILLTLASPLLIWFSSNQGIGIVPISTNAPRDSISSTAFAPAAQTAGEINSRIERPDLLESSQADELSSPASRGAMDKLDAQAAERAFVPAGSTLTSPSPRQFLKLPSAESICRVGVVFGLVWAAVAAWLAMRLVRGLFVIYRLRRSLRATNDPRLVQAANLALPLSGPKNKHSTPIFESHLAPTPLSVGCWRPMIVMPEGLASSLDDEQLACVLAHEGAHVARHDTAFALLQQLAAIGFWWNPLLHAVNRQIDQLRERICDDYVVRQFGDGVPLAEAIIKVAEWSAARDVRIPLATTLLDDASNMEHRIMQLVERNHTLSVRLSAMSVAVIGLFGIILATVPLIPAIRAQTKDGSYTYRAVAAGYETAISKSTPFTEGDTTVDFELQPKPVAIPDDSKAVIQVQGRAKNAAGEAIAEATIYLVSTNGIEKQLGEVKTDAEGRYEFRDVQLPLRQPSQAARGGTFQVYGQAAGYAFAWHGMRHYLPEARPEYAPKDIDESGFYQGEPIEMNLTFRPTAKLRGRVIDEKGNPLAETRLALSSLDYLDHEGHEMHQNYREFWGIQFLPARFREARTDADGRFEIDGLPRETCSYVIVEHSRFATQTFFAAITDKQLSEYLFSATTSVSVSPSGKQVRMPKWEIRKVRTGPLDIRLESTEHFTINVVHDDDGKPAKNIRVYAYSGDSAVGTSVSRQTDEQGRAELALPNGKYRLVADPPRDSNYVRTKSELEVRPGTPQQTETLRLKAGCILILETVSAEDGSPIPGVSLWCDDDGKQGHRVGVQSSTTYIDNPVTNQKGELHVVVLPGTRHYGIGWSPLPNGYRAKPNTDKQLVECLAGKTVRVRFELSK